MRRAVVLALALAACSVEKMPPIVMIRHGSAGAVKRVAILPAECGTTLCQGLEAIVAADLTFRGYDVIDLARIAAVERKRTEVIVSDQASVDGVRTAGASRHVVVEGAMLSDLDVWTLRDELAADGVEAVVRVRTADVQGSPARAQALVRVTRTADASLVWSSLCEVEVSVLATAGENAERALRCALAGAQR